MSEYGNYYAAAMIVFLSGFVALGIGVFLLVGIGFGFVSLSWWWGIGVVVGSLLWLLMNPLLILFFGGR